LAKVRQFERTLPLQDICDSAEVVRRVPGEPSARRAQCQLKTERRRQRCEARRQQPADSLEQRSRAVDVTVSRRERGLTTLRRRQSLQFDGQIEVMGHKRTLVL